MGYLERGASPLQAHHGALVLAERGRRGRVGMRRHWGEADLQEVTAECGIIHSLGPAVELLQPVQAVGCQVFQAGYEGRTAINASLLMQLSRVQCQGLTQKGYLPQGFLPGVLCWGQILSKPLAASCCGSQKAAVTHVRLFMTDRDLEHSDGRWF